MHSFCLSCVVETLLLCRCVTNRYAYCVCSTPALGDFDGDGVLDLLVLWGHGEWDEYDYAIVSTDF